tara:strand:+ start:279 stop:458 length:180 start_codon:yes stop_codon:yes gene_type:complete
MPNTLEISMKIGKILGLAEATKSTLNFNNRHVEDTPLEKIEDYMNEIIKAANEIDLHEK